MWVLKVYIIPLERAIEHFPRTTSRTCACSRRTTRSSGRAESAVYPMTTRGRTSHSKNVGATPPPAAHGPTVACCGRPHLGAASPHPHGRRQRLPRVLGEQQQPQRGEHLDEVERQLDYGFASRSRGLGGIVR